MRTITVNEDRMRQALLNRGMATQEVEAILRDLNGETPPKGYIRFKDALRKYNIKQPTLTSWLRRGHVRQIRPRWKLCFVNEQDLRARVTRLKATKHKA